jgi:uncharacterized protein
MTISTADLQRVFVDTSAWLALLNRKDRNHEAAAQFHRSLSPSTLRVITWGIHAEMYTWLRYHLGYRQAARWLHEEAALEDQGFLEIVFPSASMETAVRLNLARFADQDLSYVDAFSLHVVQSRRDINAIFAFDHHLTLVGVPVFPGPVHGLGS